MSEVGYYFAGKSWSYNIDGVSYVLRVKFMSARVFYSTSGFGGKWPIWLRVF